MLKVAGYKINIGGFIHLLKFYLMLKIDVCYLDQSDEIGRYSGILVCCMAKTVKVCYILLY